MYNINECSIKKWDHTSAGAQMVIKENKLKFSIKIALS